MIGPKVPINVLDPSLDQGIQKRGAGCVGHFG
jgi:hypothetical protein